MIIEKKYCMNIKMKNIKYYIDDNQIHWRKLHSSFMSSFNFISFFGLIFLIFKKRKNTNSYYKNIVIFETKKKQNSSSLRFICCLLEQIKTVA